MKVSFSNDWYRGKIRHSLSYVELLVRLLIRSCRWHFSLLASFGLAKTSFKQKNILLIARFRG